MDTGILTEVLLWVVQLSQSHQLHRHPLLTISWLVEHTPNISNFIIFVYLVVVVFNKKGRYIAAFLICDVFAATYNYTSNTGYEIYLGYVFIYSILYWVITIDNTQLKTRLACGIIVLFDARMTLHAYFNGDYEAFIYVNYEYITLLTHLCLISTLLPWQLIRRSVADYFRAIYSKLRYSDRISYICYNLQIQTKQTAKK